MTIGFNAVASLAAGKVDAATGFWNAEGVALAARASRSASSRSTIRRAALSRADPDHLPQDAGRGPGAGRRGRRRDPPRLRASPSEHPARPSTTCSPPTPSLDRAEQAGPAERPAARPPARAVRPERPAANGPPGTSNTACSNSRSTSTQRPSTCRRLDEARAQPSSARPGPAVRAPSASAARPGRPPPPRPPAWSRRRRASSSRAPASRAPTSASGFSTSRSATIRSARPAAPPPATARASRRGRRRSASRRPCCRASGRRRCDDPAIAAPLDRAALAELFADALRAGPTSARPRSGPRAPRRPASRRRRRRASSFASTPMTVSAAAAWPKLWATSRRQCHSASVVDLRVDLAEGDGASRCTGSRRRSAGRPRGRSSPAAARRGCAGSRRRGPSGGSLARQRGAAEAAAQPLVPVAEDGADQRRQQPAPAAAAAAPRRRGRVSGSALRRRGSIVRSCSQSRWESIVERSRKPRPGSTRSRRYRRSRTGRSRRAGSSCAPAAPARARRGRGPPGPRGTVIRSSGRQLVVDPLGAHRPLPDRLRLAPAGARRSGTRAPLSAEEDLRRGGRR